MIRRSSALALRFVAWLVASMAIIAAIVLWRLASGPLSLEPLTPYIENALSPDGGDLRIEVGATQIQLRETGLELVVLDVQGVRPGGERVFDLPEIEVDLSLAALLTRGLIAPVRLDARAPRLVLVRRADGTVALAGDRQEAADGPTADVDVRVLAALLDRDDPSEPLAYLEELRFAGGRLVMEDDVADRRLRADDAELVLARQDGGLAARLAFAVREAGADAQVAAVAELPEDGERVAFEVTLASLEPALLRELVPSLPAELEGLDLALGAHVAGDVTLAGEVSALRFQVASDGGVVRLPDHLAGEVPLDAFLARGRIGANFTELVIDSLRLETQETTVTGSGRVYLGEAGPGITADLAAQHVTVEDLRLLWPLAVADDARAWVLENITEGRAPRGEIHVELRPGELGQKPLREDAVRGSFEIEDATIRYFKHLPPLVAVDARADVSGQTMTFRVSGGHYEDLEIADGLVTIAGIGIEGDYTTTLDVAATIRGPVPTALALIDREPFGFAAKLGIDPAATRGSSLTELEVGLPLYKEVEEEEVTIAADATLEGVAADGLMGEVDLTDGAFLLAVDRAHMDLQGTAVVEGVPLDVTWRENFADDAEVDRRYELSGFLDQAQLAQLGLGALPVPVSGGFAFDVTGTERDSVQAIEASLDLGALAVEVPPLDWRKRAGEPADLHLEATVPEDGPVTVDSFAFDGAALEAVGSLVLLREPPGLRELTLDRFSYRRQEASGHLVRDGEALAIEVRARSLDLDPLLGDESEGLFGDDDEDAAPPTPLSVSLRADEVFYGGDALTAVSVEAERTAKGWQSAEATAQLPDAASLRLILEPRPEGSHLLLTSDDASDVLRVLDQTQRIEGGDLRLEATIAEQVPELRAKGTFRVEDFTILDAPLLARLLTLASLGGVRNLLGGEGIAVNRLKLPFTIADDVLAIDDGRLSGSQLGLTLNGDLHLATERLDMRGTIVPIYTLNRVLGNIPLIGQFLTGEEGEGAFAFTFRVRGNVDDPEISVNPLSVLAPGFVRELFGGIRRGDLEPPTPVIPDIND